MDASGAFRRLAASIEREGALVAGLPVRAAAADAFVDEVWSSTALADSPLDRAQVAALLGRGVPVGEHRLEAYVLVADYGAAARYVRDAAGVGRRRPYLRSEEIVDLHALVTQRAHGERPGAWRSTTLVPFPSGMVAPPAWLVPREIAAYCERLVAGPAAGTAPVGWVAAAHARFERIHPFSTANGRVGRLVANLLLRRLGLPSLVVRSRDGAAYVAALRRADARDPWPLATIFARSVLAGLQRARAAQAGDPLVPLASLASAGERPAFYKAAQRGRLLAVRRGGTLLSTQAWVDAYRAEKARR
jgi:Fic family protein